MKLKENLHYFIYLFFFISMTTFIISCDKENKTSQNTQNTTEKKDDSTEKKTTQSSGSGSTGKDFFYKKSSENNIACADCHSDGTNNANPLTKYFSNIQGANKRTSTFLGKFTGEEVVKNAGGATLCWQEYMRMKTPLTEEQIAALNQYYSSVAAPDSPLEIKYETIALPVKDKAKLKNEQKIIMALKGDNVKGEQAFNNSCAFCHGENSTVRKVPSILEDFEGNVKSITFNVRLGDGSMPFFHKNNLSDQDVADIAAYLLKKSGQ